MWPGELHIGQGDAECLMEEEALSGQSADIWSGLPQEKHVDFFLVASAESHVATSSGSVLDQHAWGLEANFSLNCVSYCSHAYS